MNKETEKMTPIKKQTKPVNHVLRALIIMGTLLGVALLATTFMGGYLTGLHSAKSDLERFAFNKRQLTENLDKPLRERPLLNKAAHQINGNIKKHGLKGHITEVEGNSFVLDTQQGARIINLTNKTKILQGPEKKPVDLKALQPGSNVVVLSKKTTNKDDQTDVEADVIIINPLPDQEPLGPTP